MLKSIHLTCFRQHEDRRFDFSSGLNTVRGANEAGKSGLLMAIGYALFGAKALTDDFEEIVTWGRKPNELKVVLEYEVGDTIYVFSRGKGGAEVKVDGKVTVTGQVEVSNFAAQLLGADASLAANLMIATQNGLRGVLDGGPKATSTLIEDLANFDLIDRILEAAQTKLTLGSDSAYKARIETLESYLGNLPAVDEPDVAAFERDGVALSNAINGWTAKISAELEPAADTAARTVNDEAEKRSRAASLNSQLQQIDRQIRETNDALALIPAIGELADTTGVERQIAELGQARERREAYEKFLKLPEPETERIMLTAFTAGKQTVVTNRDMCRKTELDATQAIAVAKAQLVTASVCGLCGQDVSQFPEAKRKNEELYAEISKQQGLLDEAQASYRQQVTLLNQISDVETWQDGLIRLARPISNFLEWNEDVIPCLYRWKGEIPAEVTDSEPALRRQLAELKEANAVKIANKAKVESLTPILHRAQRQRDELAGQIAGVQAIDDDAFSRLTDALLAANLALSEARMNVANLEVDLGNLTDKFNQARDHYLRVKQQREQLMGEVATTREQMVELEFNNSLVKKIRAARPIIANKLWHMVLTSVSTIFTMMRGETSIVTKGSKGFEVNGHSASSLSGSAKDLLGLAVRAALIKTFTPACPFIVLDEAAASMDQDRTTSMLGYVAASGFQQVLLVTHEEVSESFANNVIRL